MAKKREPSKKGKKEQNILDRPSSSIHNQNFSLKRIKPLTENQEKFFNLYDEGYHIICSGVPGTGKTLISLYKALLDLLANDTYYSQIIIVRSCTPTKDIGFLPGDEKEKSAVYTLPYQTICNDLFQRGDAWNILTQRKIINFETTSFLRGITWKDSIIICDEFENFTLHEGKTVFSRLGENSKLICCGDYNQSDLIYSKTKTGMLDLLKIFNEMPSVKQVEFGIDDIVRSGFCKEFILAQHKLGML